MDGEFVLMILSRWLHILSAAVMAGGAIFMRFALLPVLEAHDAGTRSEWHEAIIGRWKVFIHSGIAISLFSGFYNFYVRFHEVKPMPYHALFGLKFLLAMVVFFIASALVGKSRGLQPMRQNLAYGLTSMSDWCLSSSYSVMQCAMLLTARRPRRRKRFNHPPRPFFR